MKVKHLLTKVGCFVKTGFGSKTPKLSIDPCCSIYLWILILLSLCFKKRYFLRGQNGMNKTKRRKKILSLAPKLFRLWLKLILLGEVAKSRTWKIPRIQKELIRQRGEVQRLQKELLIQWRRTTTARRSTQATRRSTMTTKTSSPTTSKRTTRSTMTTRRFQGARRSYSDYKRKYNDKEKYSDYKKISPDFNGQLKLAKLCQPTYFRNFKN